MTRTAYQQAVALLGPHAVLVPIKPGTKAAAVKGWQALDLLQTSETGYRERLRVAVTLAAILGPQSRDLAALDFDTDEAADEFLALNPHLNETLRTRGVRGCVLWVVMVGSYPSRCQILRDGMDAAVGEWRAGACYSVISGLHPTGAAYQVLVAEPPMPIEFGSLRWPASWHAIPVHDSPEMGERSVRRQVEGDKGEEEDGETGTIQKTASSIGYGDGIKKKRVVVSLENRNCDYPQVIELYDRFVEPRWKEKKGRRNYFITKAVPFLFNAMCDEAVMAVIMRFYDENHQLFKDSRKTHQYEGQEHLANVAERYQKNLKSEERKIYHQLPSERKRAAFRICRHLAARPSLRDECEDEFFFLAYGDLGTRLLIDGKGARKLMNQFIKLGIVEMVAKGRKWEPNRRPLATIWRYCL